MSDHQAVTIDRPETMSAWNPLHEPLFRSLRIASLVSNLGTWMQNVGGTRLMTLLTPSPVMVALMQTATTLPVFLVGFSAGALADIVARRRLILLTQGWMLVAAILLGVLTLMGATIPWLLLPLTFTLGLGAAMNMPAWQAITPELVWRSELLAAVALSSIGMNMARAIGPALGGLIGATAGAGTVFLPNAVSFVGVMRVVYGWQRPTAKACFRPSM